MAAWDTVSKGICIRSTVKMANKRFSSVRHWLTHLGEGYNDLFSPHYLLFLTFAGNLVRRNCEKTILEVKLTIALHSRRSKSCNDGSEICWTFKVLFFSFNLLVFCCFLLFCHCCGCSISLVALPTKHLLPPDFVRKNDVLVEGNARRKRRPQIPTKGQL